MKVFIVLEIISYEGALYKKVFSTFEAAEKYINSINEPKYCREFKIIEDEVLQ